jgi:vanillate O-demethylase monooxygenase subunit
MWGADLVAGALESRRILGMPIVLFRREDGTVAANSDMCPHRFAPLHKGCLLPGDRLRCSYHGLEFDWSGACVRNPHGSNRIPPSAKLRNYPAVEKHSGIWVWMGDAAADPTIIPDYSVLDEADPTMVSKREWIRIEAGYRLITENLLDLSHISFLHDGILGNEDTIPAKISIEQKGTTLRVGRWMPNVRVPAINDLMFMRDGRRVDLWANMRWDAPACLLNDTGVTDVGAPVGDGTGIFGIHILTPETETSTLYHFVAVRQNPRSWGESIDREVRQKLTDLRHHAFENQDRVMIEAQHAAILDPALDTSRPSLLDVDAGPVRFHRILDRMIADEESSGHSNAVQPV